MDYNKYYMDLLKKLISIPSSSQDEKACILFLADFLRCELGMQVSLQQVEENSWNLIGLVRGKKYTGSGKKLLLGGHIDTVSAAEGWTTNPLVLTVVKDRAYGLGAADMKGGLAAQITVLKQIVDSGCNFDGEIELAVLCDEERYSIGANAYVKQAKEQIMRGDMKQTALPCFALFGEPHYDNIIVGATGKVLLSLLVSGVAGHAANPETGINAIDCLTLFLTAINRKYDSMYASGTAASHCVLRIESKYAGYSLNIPDECVALLNKQLYVSEKTEAFVEDLQDIYRNSVGKGTLAIRKEVPYYPSYQLDQRNGDFQKLLALLRNQYGLEPELRTNQSVSDGNILYSELGIPTILFGPEGHDYHKPNEYLVLSSAYRYMEVLYDFLKQFF